MPTAAPRVTIGLPVLDGEKYLEVALDSLLNQSFQDFEIIISDNGSTDRTQEICRQYTERDARIRYSRNPENIGAARNHNLVFRGAAGEFFMWAAYDDIYAPELLSRSVEMLDSHPSAVLCFPIVSKIDEHVRVTGTVQTDRGTSADVRERFRSLIVMHHGCEQIYGLIRTAVLRKTRLHGSYTDSDRTLLSELCLYGPFVQLPEALFLHRVHPASSTTVYPNWRQRMRWFEPKSKGRWVFPHWIQCFHLCRMVARAPIRMKDRLRCYVELLGWLRVYGKRMVKDVLVAVGVM